MTAFTTNPPSYVPRQGLANNYACYGTVPGKKFYGYHANTSQTAMSVQQLPTTGYTVPYGHYPSAGYNAAYYSQNPTARFNPSTPASDTMPRDSQDCVLQDKALVDWVWHQRELAKKAGYEFMNEGSAKAMAHDSTQGRII